MSVENGANRTRLQRDCADLLKLVDTWVYPHNDLSVLMDKINMQQTHRTMFRDRALNLLSQVSSVVWESLETTTPAKVRSLVYLIEQGYGLTQTVEQQHSHGPTPGRKAKVAA